MTTTPDLYKIYQQHPAVCTDTRKITPDCLFFALKGENFDGNKFADEALRLGAAYVVVDEENVVKDERYLLTENVLEALQNLAAHHRSQLHIPVIAITGTNGKTTTKELVYSVLSQRFTAYATQGNLNNHIGVPLTLLSINESFDIAIVEMGANHRNEIKRLCQIAQPTHGLITNVGKAHLEGFGGFEGVRAAKGELYEYLATHKGLAFLNRDNAYLMEMAKTHQLDTITYYGTGEENFVRGVLTQNFPLAISWTRKTSDQEKKDSVESNLTGIYNFENLLAAITIGCFFDLSTEEIDAGISSYVPVNNRSQVKKTESNIVICDYYNANPSSMVVALDNLASLDADNKVFILGDMFELGLEAEKEHEAIVRRGQQLKTTRRIFIGTEFFKLKSGESEFYKTTAEAAAAINRNPISSSTVLVKGSRGMKMENLIDYL